MHALMHFNTKPKEFQSFQQFSSQHSHDIRVCVQSPKHRQRFDFK